MNKLVYNKDMSILKKSPRFEVIAITIISVFHLYYNKNVVDMYDFCTHTFILMSLIYISWSINF